MDITEALRLHLVCYSANFEVGSIKLDKAEEYARNTAYYLFTFLISHSQFDNLFDVVNSLYAKEQTKLDPIEEPLVKAIDMIGVVKVSKPIIHKISGRLDYLKRELNRSDRWYDRFAMQRVIECAVKTVQTLARRAKES